MAALRSPTQHDKQIRSSRNMNNPIAHDIDQAIKVLAQQTFATACEQEQHTCPTQEQMDNAYQYLKKITSEQDAALFFLDQPEKYLATSALRQERCTADQPYTFQALMFALLCATIILGLESMKQRPARSLKHVLLITAVLLGLIYGLSPHFCT